MKIKLAIFIVCFAIVSSAQRRSAEPPTRLAARGTRGAVAAGSEFAAEAGMRIFHQDGNAVDAGVAAMLAAAVAEYSHFGFGGEAPILIRTKDGRIHSIAGVGTMPQRATAEFFRQRRLVAGEVLRLEPGGLKGMVPVAGLMPALVPGMVDAALLALREFGTKSFGQVVSPAIQLADGMPMDETRSGSIRQVREFIDLWPTSRRVFLPQGHVPQPGDLFRQPDLAHTLRSMVEAEKKVRAGGSGRATAIDAIRDYFYRGEIARRIDAFCRAHGGLLRYEDMAAFHLRVEQPASTSYRGYRVFKPGFWSQGPVMLQILNLIEAYDLEAMRHNSADYLHTLVEAMKLGYADRDTYYADPKFVRVPARELLSKSYATERRKLISSEASLEFRPGTIVGQTHARHPSRFKIAHSKIDDVLMAHDTTCVNTIDHTGTTFSATPSGAWLPSVIAGETGIPLTQRAQSFLLIPNHPNELAGGKRPRVTLSPTLVTREGKPYLVLSTPGGDNQDQALLQLLLNVVHFHMSVQAAVEAPRVQSRHLVSSFDNHAMNPGELFVDERITAAVRNELFDRGHKIQLRPRFATGAATVMILLRPNGVIEAGADPSRFRVAHAW